MAEVNILAQHGWGFGADCWDDWRDVLPANFTLHCSDRGYFGPVVATVSRRFQILITHSFGLHMVVPEFVAAAELVVVISGFRHFHAERPSSARRSRRTVEQMLVRLQDEPEALLVDFHARCGTGVTGGIDRTDGTEDFGGQSRVVDRRRLYGDLQFLQDSFLDLYSLSGVGRVLVLHGDHDRIVPRERATDLHRALCNSELSVVAAAGHALPMTHARGCWQEIERVWNMRCARR